MLSSKIMLRSLLGSVLAAVLLGGCTDKQREQEASPASVSPSSSPAIDVAAAKDSSDLPDWQGKQLSLKYWYAHGTGNLPRNNPSHDVVTPEILRVTGVQIDPKQAYDNAGESADAKLAKMVAAKDYPDIAIGIPEELAVRLAKSGTVYDLTALLPQYAPDLYKSLSGDALPLVWSDPRVTGGEADKLYGVPVKIQNKWFSSIYPDEPSNGGLYDEPRQYHFFYIRDDILKQLYPDAKTQDEIEELYVANGGSFTDGDIWDVPIETEADFRKLLSDIKALNLREDNKPVQPFYVFSGGDNWQLLTQFAALFGRNIAGGSDTNYVTYFDKLTNRIEYTFTQPSFKEEMKFYTGLVQDGLASKESLVDNGAVFKQKLNSGQYAVTLPNHRPDESVLKAAGKDYRYRKVYMKIEPQEEQFLFTTGSASNGMDVVHIFKDKVKEEDVPQILQYLNYFWTEAGKKVVYWGPRSAGLFTEEGGVRKFVDKEIEDALVYGKQSDKLVQYNLDGQQGGVTLIRPEIVANNFHPKVVYRDKELNKNDAFGKFVPDAKARLIPSVEVIFTKFTSVDGIKEFQTKRTNFEQALTRVFTAANNEEFEKLYNQLLVVAKDSGLTEETLAEINLYYAEDLNREYMGNIK